MAKKISELPELINADADDLLTYADVSDNSSKSSLAKDLVDLVPPQDKIEQPHIFRFLRGLQVIAGSIWTEINFNDDFGDDYGMSSGFGIKIPSDGMYLISAHASVMGLTVGTVQLLRTMINGVDTDSNILTTYKRVVHDSGNIQINGVGIYNKDDLITVYVYQGTGGDLDLRGQILDDGTHSYHGNTFLRVIKLSD